MSLATIFLQKRYTFWKSKISQKVLRSDIKSLLTQTVSLGALFKNEHPHLWAAFLLVSQEVKCLRDILRGIQNGSSDNLRTGGVEISTINQPHLTGCFWNKEFHLSLKQLQS